MKAKPRRKARSSGTSIKLLPVDIQIIRYLHEDARSSIAKISERMAMPESTVRHRLSRLVKHGIVEFAVLTNPFHFGYQVWVMISLQVEMSKVRSVAERLTELPEVYLVAVTTGASDIMTGAVFRTNEELLNFITNRLSKIPGITATRTAPILDMVKRTMSFGAPQEITEPIIVRRAAAVSADGGRARVPERPVREP